jgi:hypothetical protein
LLRVNDTVVLAPDAAACGIEVCRRMMDVTRASVSGEDRAEVHSFIAGRVEEWTARLEGR